MPSEAAAACVAFTLISVGGLLGLIKMRDQVRGRQQLVEHLQAASALPRLAIPVMFPPGLAKLATRLALRSLNPRGPKGRSAVRASNAQYNFACASVPPAYPPVFPPT